MAENESLAVELHLGRNARELDPGARSVTDDQRAVYHYEKLLLPPAEHLAASRPRSLYRRMEQLEARVAPNDEPLIINVRFISAVDKRVTGGFQARIPQLGPARNSVIKQYR